VIDVISKCDKRCSECIQGSTGAEEFMKLQVVHKLESATPVTALLQTVTCHK
jgi:hypothetical protein